MVSKIGPGVVKTLRKRSNLTQAELAEYLGVSKRQVAEWEREDGAPVEPLESNFKNLCKLFRINEDQLSGLKPLPTDNLGDQAKQQFTVRLTQQNRLNYELIDWRYGISRDELIAIAPMLFVLVARQSLAWREEQLKRCRTAIETLKKTEDAFVASDVSKGYVESTEHALDEEEEDIRQEEIFTPSLPDLDYEISFSNRFNDYLRSTAQNDFVLEYYGPVSRFPSEYLVTPGTFEEICGGADAPQKHRAAYALASGSARLSEIPPELRDVSNRTAMSEWLAERAPAPADGVAYDFESSRFGMVKLAKLA